MSIKIKLKLPIKLKQYCISPSLNIYAFCNNLGHTNKIMFISLVPYTKFDDKNWIYCGIYYYYGIIFIVIIIVWYTGFVLSHGLLYTSLSWERAFMESYTGKWKPRDVAGLIRMWMSFYARPPHQHLPQPLFLFQFTKIPNSFINFAGDIFKSFDLIFNSHAR